MKVLVLSAYYTPEITAGMYLFTNLFEDMTKQDWNVELYSPLPTRGVDDATRKAYQAVDLETQYNGKLKIHRFYMPREGKNAVLRAARYLLINLVFLSKGLSTSADVLLLASTPPTQGAIGAILKRLTGIHFIYNLQDIFPDSLVSTGLAKKNSVLWKIGRKIEDFSYKNADKIIVISEDFKTNLLAKGVPEEKIEVIYNWVDEEAIVRVEKCQNDLFSKYDLDQNKFYITYCGTIGLTQNIELLLDVAGELALYSDIMFILVGDGAYKEEAMKTVALKKIQNVKFLPFQPYSDISKVFSLGDVGLVISKVNVGQNSVPSKTWSIMSAEQPILASFDLNSELCSIIRKAYCGLCVPAGNKEKLTDAILYFYRNRGEAIQQGKNGRKYIMGNLTRSHGTSKYIDIIKQYDS